MSATQEQTAQDLSLLSRIKAIALEGLKFAENAYDVARYKKLLEISAEGYSGLMHGMTDALLKKFHAEIGITTPKIGVDAVVFNEQGHLLVLKREGSGLWCLPGGWVDVGETLAEAAQRELLEETGLSGQVAGCIALVSRAPSPEAHIEHQVIPLILMEKVEGAVVLSHEHTEYRWIEEGETLPWFNKHEEQVRHAFVFLKSSQKTVLPIT